MTKELTLSKSGIITPQTFTELMEYAKILANSDLVPRDFRGKPGNIIIALQMGAEVGLSHTQALQSIGVVNGKPAIYGDGAAGLVRRFGNPSIFKEYEIGERGSKDWKNWNDDYGYACEIKRKGSEEVTKRTFTVADAKRAGLWGKIGPWSTYPQRMLQMRARSWSMRDSHSDVLKGLAIYEEAIDIEPLSDSDKAIVSINDFKPVETEQVINYIEDLPDNDLSRVAKKPEISIEQLRDRIKKASMYLGDNDEQTAALVYHGFADIIKGEKKVINKNGEESIKIDKIVAPSIALLSISQARVVWGKIKKHFEEKKLDIKKELNYE